MNRCRCDYPARMGQAHRWDCIESRGVIDDIVRSAWAESPGRTLLAFALTPVIAILLGVGLPVVLAIYVEAFGG